MAATDPRSIIARLAVAVMAADGRITAGELDVASHLDSLGLGDLSGPVRAEIQIAMRDPIDPVAVCGELTPLSREAAATIVAALAEIALADRVLSRRESQVLFLIARALGLHDSETEHLDSEIFAPSSFVATPAEKAVLAEWKAAGLDPSGEHLDNSAHAHKLSLT